MNRHTNLCPASDGPELASWPFKDSHASVSKLLPSPSMATVLALQAVFSQLSSMAGWESVWF